MEKRRRKEDSRTRKTPALAPSDSDDDEKSPDYTAPWRQAEKTSAAKAREQRLLCDAPWKFGHDGVKMR